jgi:dienelactone hydrolase
MNMRRLFAALAIIVLSEPVFSQKNYAMQKDISYVSASETSSYRRERCKLDVYYPTDVKGFKTVVWFHGGGLEGGSKEIRSELMNAGIAVVAPNYRLSPKAKNPEYTEDAAAAVAWTFKHINEFGGDASKIFVAGHSAGGYLTLMLALDKSYLAACGVDADSVKCYFPVSGQTATHYTIRKERHVSFTSPVVDKYAPLNNVRKLNTDIVLITGDRSLEQMARYEENLYLKVVLEGIGNKTVPIHELSGFNHGEVVAPACQLIKKYLKTYR